MTIRVGTLLKHKTKDCFTRILEINRQAEFIVAIHFNSNGTAREHAKLFDYDTFMRSLQENFHVNLDDPFIEVRTEDQFSKEEMQRINERYAIIYDLISNEKKKLYDSTFRIETTTKIIGRHPGLKRRKVNDHLKRYHVRGSSKYSLATNYKYSGALGVIREPGSKLRGRPSKKRKMNITSADRKKIRSIANEFLYTDEGTIESAYDQLIIRHYSSKGENGELIENDVKPTLGQFVHWSNKLLSSQEKLIGKKGLLNFKRSYRLLHGKANDNITAAGMEYIADWSVYPVDIVSSVNRNQVIGPLIVYFIRDGATKMTTGYFCTIENASYATGALAFEQAICDKYQWAKRNKLELPAGSWPCCGKPLALYGDRGEYVSLKSDVMVNNLNVMIDNAPPYRPDLKATVEIGFKIGKNRIKPLMKGFGLKNYDPAPHTARTYKAKAALTLEEANEIIFLSVLEANMAWMDEYPLTDEMRADGVQPIPLQLWNWFEERGECKLRAVDENKIRYLLLPQTECRLHRGGIKFLGMDYVPKDKNEFSIVEGLFLNDVRKIKIAFDPRMLSDIYLVHKEKFYCLRPRGRRETFFQNYWEMLIAKSLSDIAKSEHKEQLGKMRRKNTLNIQRITKQSRRKQLPGGASTTNISKEREKEKLRNRRKDLAKVHQPPTKSQSSDFKASRYYGRVDYTVQKSKSKK